MLVEVGEILRISNSSEATMHAVATALAHHLELSRCFFADLADGGGGIVRVHRGSPRDEVGALALAHPLYVRLASGRVVVTPELVAVPLERDRAVRATLVVGAQAGQTPRTWAPNELALVQDVAERTWLWLERERLVGELTQLTHELEARVEQRTHELNASLREKEVLLKEIHHRVKNNLQVVTSLLSLSRERIADPLARDVLRESQDRVRSMALVHEKLYRNGDLARVAFRDYVRELTDHLLAATSAAERGITATLAMVDTIGLAIDHAIPCGLIVNELVTNALKHAFPDGKRGRITIALSRSADPTRPGTHIATLIVADDGVGIPSSIDPAKASSFGLDLVMTFADQLDAEVQVLREVGTEFRFRFATQS